MVKTIDQLLEPISKEIRECQKRHHGEYCCNELTGEKIKDPKAYIVVNGNYYAINTCNCGVEGDGTLVIEINPEDYTY